MIVWLGNIIWRKYKKVLINFTLRHGECAYNQRDTTLIYKKNYNHIKKTCYRHGKCLS
jgi:hypothetical protein